VTNRIQLLASQRESDCYVARRALEMWLSRLTPVRWLTVIGTTLLSAIAGATILGAPMLLGRSFPTVAGLCAFTASLLSALHTALHCDAHQAECRRMISLYIALEAAFQALQVLPHSQMEAKAEELEKRYEEVLNSTTAAPPVRFRRRAMNERIEVSVP
jgi:hypothetical protein